MYRINSERELIDFATSILTEIVTESRSNFDYLPLSIIGYEHFNTASIYITKIKLLYFIIVSKLRSLGINNISSHTFIMHIKTECSLMKSAFNQVIVSVKNISEEYSESIQNIITWFDEFAIEEI